MGVLSGYKILNLSTNLPGPFAAARLRDYGAAVVKVEPPGGDAMQHLGAGWYEKLVANMTVCALDLKTDSGIAEVHQLLCDTDLLLTASRPAALARLGLDWDTLHLSYPRLCQVAIVGYPPPDENKAGHDLTYQAAYGTLDPPAMPRVLVADLAGAERAVSEAMALLFARERSGDAGFSYVALSEAGRDFGDCIRYDVTVPGGILGGGLPNYRIYETCAGYLAVAALERHFFVRLMAALSLEEEETGALEAKFMERSAKEWEDWGRENDLPLEAIH